MPEALDISDTLAPKSDQMDAVDLLGGPQTFTIERVSRNNGDQPLNIYLKEFPRPWRPGVSMRRVLVACWGPMANTYAGKRVRLWCDPAVRFGSSEVGGIRITHLSDIDKPKKVPLLITAGRSGMYPVAVLEGDGSPAAKANPRPSRGELDKLIAGIEALGLPDNERIPFIVAIIERPITKTAEMDADEIRQVLAHLDSLANESGGDQ